MNEVLPPLRSQHFLNSDSGMPTILSNMIKRDRYDSDSLRQAVEDLHDNDRWYSLDEKHLATGNPPKILFVTATSAIPYAFAIRTAWRIAYSCPPPKVFTIDVSKKRFGPNFPPDHKLRFDETDEHLTRNEEGDLARLRHLGEKYEAFGEAALFDEFNNTGTTIARGQALLEKAGFKPLRVIVGIWGHAVAERGVPISIRPVIREAYKNGSSSRRLVFNITEESRAVVEDMKTIGIEMGLEIIRRRNLNSTSS